MARGLGTLTVWLGVNSTGFSRGLTSAQRTLQKFSRSATIAGAAIGAGLTAAMVSGVRAFMVQEDAANSLAAALRATGDATDLNMAKLSKHASAMQAQTRFGDEAILSAMAYGKNLGIQAGQLDQAATAAAGLAAKYRLDLNSAMMLIGRASQGQTQMLARYGIVLDDSLDAQGKFNELLKIGADNFGLAQADATTLSGRMTQMKNAMGDVKEVIGELVVDVFDLRGAFNTGAGAVREFADTFKSNIEGIKYFIQDIGIEAFLVGKNMLAIFRASLGNIVEVFKWATGNAGKFMTSWAEIAWSVGMDYLNIWKNVITAVIDVFKAGWGAIGSIIKGGSVGDAIAGIFDTAVQGLARTIGDLGRETEKALAAAGISELRLTGFAELGKIMAENRAAADAMKERLERAALERINRGGAMGGAGATGGPEATAARSGGARTESPVFAAIRRGTLEALKAENTRVNKDDKIELNTRRAASATERVAKGIDEVVRRMPFRGVGGLVEDVF